MTRGWLTFGLKLSARQHSFPDDRVDHLLAGSRRLLPASPTLRQQHQRTGTSFAHLRFEVTTGLLPSPTSQ
jgi:hypothetical protein